MVKIMARFTSQRPRPRVSWFCEKCGLGFKTVKEAERCELAHLQMHVPRHPRISKSGRKLYPVQTMRAGKVVTEWVTVPED
jgi:hypothetical protein